MKWNEKILLPHFKALMDEFVERDRQPYVEAAHLFDVNIKQLWADQSLLDFDGIRKSNEDYIKRELNWYLSQDLNIKKISETAKIWLDVCDIDGFVNSNYGHRIFSADTGFQYHNCLNELKINPNSRRAIMQYMPIDIWRLATKNGRNDFICTNYVHCLMERDINQKWSLTYIIYQRSCDIIFGMFNDFAWHCFVYNKLFDELSKTYDMDDSEKYINWNIGSLHVYQRHIEVVKDISRLNEEDL